MANQVSIELTSVIPNFHSKYDIYDLVSCTAPRRMLLVSADEDKYSKDAPYIVEKAQPAYQTQNAADCLCHRRYPGGSMR